MNFRTICVENWILSPTYHAQIGLLFPRLLRETPVSTDPWQLSEFDIAGTGLPSTRFFARRRLPDSGRLKGSGHRPCNLV